MQVNAKICGFLGNGSEVIILFRSYMDIKEINVTVNTGFVRELEN